MKSKSRILIPGIVSIVILIAAQVYLVWSIWKQKDEMFALTYTVRSQEALNFIRRLPTDGFDTVRYLLGTYSEKANADLQNMKKAGIETNQKEEEIYQFFNQVLNREQYLSDLLSAYFERRGYERNFTPLIVITNIEMIAEDTITVYSNRSFQEVKSSGPSRIAQKKPSNIFVNWFGMEDNNYRLRFEFFIDYSDKRLILFRDMSVVLPLSLGSILIVYIIFMMTFKNLMEERRLSGLKTDFINNMTHELKTPLSTITVAGKTLEMPQILESREKILETARLIGKQSVHLNQLINMILEISMWERTQFELEKKSVDIEEIMKDIIDSFKSGGAGRVAINEKYSFSGAKADIDVVYFTTLINNLLSNAVKYSEKDPVIDVEGFTSDDGIHIRVSDNGIGISRNDQKHIFDKFYRASTGNIHKYKGLGLGLYYVKRIATAHGGDVTVNSRPGMGSTFTITVPYNQTDDESSDS